MTLEQTHENPTQYEILPIEFMGKGSQRGFHFKQLKRIGDLAIYEKVTSRETYEVIVIQRQEESFWGEIHFKARERYPNDEQFGEFAWQYLTLEAAERKFQKLLEQQEP